MTPMTTLHVLVTAEAMEHLHRLSATQQQSIELVASRRLRDALKDLPDDGRYILVTGEALDRLEKIFAGGSVLNSIDLLRKVERQAGITFNNIRFEFTPGQLEEIQRRAERLGLTTEELCRRCVQKMEELFFTHLGVGAQG